MTKRGKRMSKDIDELTRLNRDYVASVQNSDVKRFEEILAQDFYCSNPDKSRVDRAGHHPRRYELHDGGRSACQWPLHRLLGEAERPLARGVGACVAVSLGRMQPK
jgi:hypothetical protein